MIRQAARSAVVGHQFPHQWGRQIPWISAFPRPVTVISDKGSGDDDSLLLSLPSLHESSLRSRARIAHCHDAASGFLSGASVAVQVRPSLYLSPIYTSHVQVRFMSSNNSSSSNDPSLSSQASVEETLERLFAEQGQQAVGGGPTDALLQGASDAATAAATAWEPTWYNVADQAIVAIQTFHQYTGLEYGWSIIGVTVLLKLALFPAMVKSQKTSSRMAHLQPELTMMKKRYEAQGGMPSRQDQIQFGNQMRALFAKYGISPFSALLGPIIQLPLFLGMFFGLKKMPHLYPDEFSTGGMFWFIDLTVSDPYYILPVTSAVSFLALIEMGKQQMMAQNPAQGQFMINLFRVMSLAMFPVCLSFESSMLCYWTASNVLSIVQTGLLQQTIVRRYFDIWDMPKPVPGKQPESITEAAGKLVDRIQGKATSDAENVKRHNQAVEAKKKAFQMMRASRERRKGIGASQSR